MRKKYDTEVLNERDATHGDWRMTSFVAQQIKEALTGGENYSMLSFRHREALDLIATKLARIVNGNPMELDHWKDVAGYANLIAEGEANHGRTERIDDNDGPRPGPEGEGSDICHQIDLEEYLKKHGTKDFHFNPSRY